MTDEQRQARLHHHLYETCEGIEQQSKRIVKLEELVASLVVPIVSACDRDAIKCERCPLFGNGIPCELTKAVQAARELEVPL